MFRTHKCFDWLFALNMHVSCVLCFNVSLTETQMWAAFHLKGLNVHKSRVCFVWENKRHEKQKPDLWTRGRQRKECEIKAQWRLKLISATPSPLCLSILHRLHNLHLTAVYSDWKVLYTNQRSDLSELRAHGMQLRLISEAKVSVWSPFNVAAEETAEMLRCDALLHVLSVVFLQRFAEGVFEVIRRFGMFRMFTEWIEEPSDSFRTFHTVPLVYTYL